MNNRIYQNYNTNADIVFHNGDTMKFVKSLPTGLIKLIITSPPYNIGKEYETRDSIDNYLEKQEKMIDELTRILSDDGSICWQVGNYVDNGEVYPLDIFYYKIFKDRGYKLRNRIIWRFGHGLHASNRFSGRYETLLWFTKSDDYIFNLDNVRIPSKYPGKRYYKGPKKGQLSCNPKGKNPEDVWEFMQAEWDISIWDIPNVKSNHPEKTIHPCQFPVELVERCVLAFTNEDDIVYDPYAGVGSSIIGAIKNNRRGFGSEKEKQYIDIGKDRIKSLLHGKLKTRAIGTEIYVPDKNNKLAQIPSEWKGCKNNEDS